MTFKTGDRANVTMTVSLNGGRRADLVMTLNSIDKGYGLMRCIWRALRRKHGGCARIPVYGREGQPLGTAWLSRYDASIFLPVDIPFNAVSWKTTIDKLEYTPHPYLGPQEIPIGIGAI